MGTRAKALLIDITKCIGCRACEQTCKQVHNLPAKEESVLSATAYTVVEDHNGKYVRRMCMHCQDPACVSACPVGALNKTSIGAVRYDGSKCIGCRYCMVACPFKVPKYEWGKLAPYVKKCDLCAERVEQGGTTACAEACPTGATLFGDRDQLLAEARKRIVETPSYVPRIFGAEEVGGTSVFFLSDVPFEQLGFTVPPGTQPMPVLTAAALGDVPTVVMVGGSLLAGLYWITERRKTVLLAEAEAEPRHDGKERS